ncbi:MAG: hypothetical protein HQ472_03155 [Ignavibacteria bacterium]|nr:hypothetical protein [Ignavibacteria bacterium]
METKIDVRQLRLEIVPIDCVILHEESDPHRVNRLDGLISQSSILRNPPIVAEAGDGEYVVLDGATRTTAMRNRKIPHIAVQIVPYGTKSAAIGSWYHVLKPNLAKDVINYIQQHHFPKSTVSVEAARELLVSGEACLGITTSKVEAVVLLSPGERTLEEYAATLRQVVTIYGGAGEIHRIVNEDLMEVVSKKEPGAGVVMFPTFTPTQIIQFAKSKNVLPAGITRHLISGRALNVNVPIELMMNNLSTEEKNVWLQSWITEKVMSKKARFYHESVFVFDD